MKNNIAGKLVSVTLLALILTGIISPVNFCMTVSAASDTEDVIDEILKWKCDGSAQALADEISGNMGTSTADWYAVSLSRYKYNLDFSRCKTSLDSFVSSSGRLNATDKQRIAITYTAMGYSSPNIDTALNDSIGKLGIMSYAYGLIMLDCGAYRGSMIRDGIINELLAAQHSDGGWGLMQNSEIDVTAMVIQSLARYYKHKDVKSAVDNALDYISAKQQSNGTFKNYGTENAESTAQVLLALCTMNINYKTDSRFIKNGNTVYDGLMEFRGSDGGFSHTLGGNTNSLATVQSLYALISVWRYDSGKSAFFEFVSNNIEREENNNHTGKPSVEGSKPIESSKNNSSGNQSYKNPINSSNDVPAQDESPSERSTTKSNISESSLENESSTLSKAQNITEENISSQAESYYSNGEPFESHESASSNTESTATAEKIQADEQNSSTDYNTIIILCVIGVFAVVFAVLIIRKRVNKKNLIVLAVLFFALTVVAATIKIEPPEQYYNEASDTSKVESGKVTVSISCEKIAGKSKNDKLPSDGIILGDTELTIEEGDTAFDVLLSAAKKNHIQLDYDGDSGLVYVKGISCLYEFDWGELSGWMYRVNGEIPNVGCSAYKLKDGDAVEWIYTTNLGKDFE